MKILIFDFGFWIERQPNKFVNLVSSKRSSDNRKPAIQNPNWVGIFAIVLTLVFGGAVAEAQQPEKVFRIGLLDRSTASGSVLSLDVFRQELSKLGWIEGKNISIQYRFAEGKPTAYLNLRRSWFVLRQI